MTDIQVSKFVALLLASYPYLQRLGEREVAATRAAYASALSDLDERAAMGAFERLRATCKFLPSIAEIRAGALELAIGTRRRGGDAWGDIGNAISRWGMNRAPGADFEFADPIVARCVAALGWRDLCTSENPVADRARFIELYEQLGTEARADRISPRALPAGAAGGTRPTRALCAALDAAGSPPMHAFVDREELAALVGSVTGALTGGAS